MAEIRVLKDHSEIVPYNFFDFPVHAKEYWLSYYPNMSIVNHLHADFEFITIIEGQMLYLINGKEHLIKKGQCVFVNSRQLHSGRSFEGGNCRYLCMLFHPSLLHITEKIKKSYEQVIGQDSSLPFIIFSTGIGWQNETIHQLKQIFYICQKEAPGFELAVLSHFYSLWDTLFHNIKTTGVPKESPYNKKLDALHLMIGYIQEHFSEKLALNDLALAGGICRSNCCAIFYDILQISPIQYLTSYRLEKSIEYLSDTDYTITDIALQCGFNSSSYFTEVFHRELGCTPSEYREKIKLNPLPSKS
jgi:AraC-like DNA-binding protein/mannose-6-phosphate isomerase-like protein (cupin superfamily)